MKEQGIEVRKSKDINLRHEYLINRIKHDSIKSKMVTTTNQNIFITKANSIISLSSIDVHINPFQTPNPSKSKNNASL